MINPRKKGSEQEGEKGEDDNNRKEMRIDSRRKNIK
jgi:hypothetical protein